MKQVVQNRDWLIRRAAQGAPHEVCGFVMVDGSVIEIPNCAENSMETFSMSRFHLIERVDPKSVVAQWHSHPNGNPEPSDTDMLCARIFPEWGHFIVTSTELHRYDSGS